ncbi:MAG: hypothetical protein QW578_07880 [Thermoplasmatales archaeon]
MRAIGKVKVKGYVLITDGNALRSLEHNTITDGYISYLSSILLGQVPPATNVVLLTQPNNVVYNPQKLTFSVVANTATLQVTYVVTQQFTSLALYTINSQGSVPISTYTPSVSVSFTGQIAVVWTIQYDVSNTSAGLFQSSVNVTNLLNLLGYFTAPISLNNPPTQAPPTITVSPTPLTQQINNPLEFFFQINAPTQVSISVAFDNYDIISYSNTIVPSSGSQVEYVQLGFAFSS